VGISPVYNVGAFGNKEKVIVFSGEKVRGQGHGETKCTLPAENGSPSEITELINFIHWSVRLDSGSSTLDTVNDM